MFRLLSLTSAALLSLTLAPHAQSGTAETGPPVINFVLWNNGPGQSFNLPLWQSLITSNFRDGVTVSASPETGGEQIEKAVKAAGRTNPPETVVVLTATELAMSETEFETALNNLEAKKDTIDTFKGGVFLHKSPMCRAVQTVLESNAYAPFTLLYTTPEGRAACYRNVLDMLYDRDGSGTSVDSTAKAAQDLMPNAYSIGWKFYHGDGPDKGKRRDSNVFAPGEPILFETSLDYVRKKGAGAPGATFAVRLDLEVTEQTRGERSKVEDLTTYTGAVSHRVPIDANYFRNVFRAGIDLKDPGTYQITYSFTDLNAPDGRNDPVSITTEVEIR